MPRGGASGNPIEHMVLGAIAYPLLIKCLLRRAGRYTLTDIDCREIDCFEKLADTKDFLELPADSQSSLDTHWVRCWKAWIYQEAGRRFTEAFDAVETRRAQDHNAPRAASDAADEE